MNAKELTNGFLTQSIEFEKRGDSRLCGFAYGVAKSVAELVPRYRDPRPEDDGKYCYIEELPSDAPPTLVKCVPHNWVYWTVAGWRELKLGKGIWPCERPE